MSEAFFKFTNNTAIILIRNCVYLYVRHIKYNDIIKKGFIFVLCDMSSGGGNPDLTLVIPGCHQGPILLLSSVPIFLSYSFHLPGPSRPPQVTTQLTGSLDRKTKGLLPIQTPIKSLPGRPCAMAMPSVYIPIATPVLK